MPFSYEKGMEMLCFGLPFKLGRSLIRHKMKTISQENNMLFKLCHFHTKEFPYCFRMNMDKCKRGLSRTTKHGKPFHTPYVI